MNGMGVRRRVLAAGMAVVLIAPAAAGAQVVGGQVVDASAGTPLAGIPVFLTLAEGERRLLVGEAASNPSGHFQIIFAKPGTYQLFFGDTARPIGVGPIDTISTDSVHLRQYAVPLFAHNFLKTEVGLPAQPSQKNQGPEYPANLRNQGVNGEVQLEFVIDTTGRVDAASIKVHCATAPEFEKAVRKHLARVRFIPAKWRGFTVRQFVDLPYQFGVISFGAEPQRSSTKWCPSERRDGSAGR